MQDVIFFLVGVLFAVAGIILTVYLRPGRRLNVFLETDHLVERRLSVRDDLSIEFHGKKVTGIARHVLYVWNSGNVSVRESDVSNENQLSAAFTENSLLHVESVKKVGHTFRIEPVIADNIVKLTFNHVDVGQGFIIEVYEALIDIESYRGPIFDGYILDSKGIMSGVKPDSIMDIVRENKKLLILIAISPIFALLPIVGVNLYFSILRHDNFAPFKFVDNFMYFLILFPMIICLLAVAAQMIKPLRYRVPNFRGATK